MIENRPIVAISIGYIIGIIMGLYCKISIVFLYLIFFIIYIIVRKKPHNKKFKLISFRRYFRYVKIIFSKKVIIIILISSFISNTITIYKNHEFDKFQNNYNDKKIQFIGTIISNENVKKHNSVYLVKTNNKKIYIKSKQKIKLNYGDKIEVRGIFKKPTGRKNYKGFDYREYLKTKGIYGTVECEHIHKLQNSKKSSLKISNDIFIRTKKFIEDEFEKDVSSIILGIVLGYTDEISEDVRENFSESNISHILAVSGMHVGYIIMICTYILGKILGKRKGYYLSIIFCTIYMFITGMSPSVVRASIMAILGLIAKLIYRKSDIWTNISLSIMALILYNPFLIQNIGLILSYLGVVGILVYFKIFKCKNKALEIILISATISTVNLPFLSIYFYKIPVSTVIFSSFLSIFVAPIITLFFILIIIKTFGTFQIIIILKMQIKIINSFLIKCLILLTKIIAKMPLSKIYVVRPNLFEIIAYYAITSFIFALIYIYREKVKHRTFNQRIKNLISLLKYRFNQNKNKCISIVIIFILAFTIIRIAPRNLEIHFIDVGQGDSCLVLTPNNKKILIDGGGSETYNVGKNTLIPYLLARKIKKLDYVIISHFDTDHVGGLLTVMEELKVNTVIISKQGEDSENYRKFREIVKKKKIKVQVVGKGDRFKIENDVYFDILWPNNDNLVSDNVLNNNSIVCKLNYKDFSMLFTGDIEEIAEKQILSQYKNNLEILNSTILKVAHHGSKTSSIQNFVDIVKPKIALIGVGENNKFGHPNEDVIKRLEKLR